MKNQKQHLWLALTGPLIAVGLALQLASPAQAQTAGVGWTFSVHATGVSTVSGGEALAADLVTGDLFVKSLLDPSGLNVQLARVGQNGSVTILATFPSLDNSDISGIAIDPLTGGIIVADAPGVAGGRIVLIDLFTLSSSTLFNVPWVMNPNSNGTGQQQYATDPTNPALLYFWDSTVSKLFRLDRSTGTLQELLALDQGTAVGQHLTTYTNHVVFDSATATLLLTDGSSNSILEVNPATVPASVTTLFPGLPITPVGIALNPLTNQVFVQVGFSSIYVGPRSGGSLSLVASGFTFLTDIVTGSATARSGLSLFAVSKTLNTVYEIEGAGDKLNDLISQIQGFNLAHGIANSLVVKLQNDLTSVSAGNFAAACSQLNAFIAEVQAQSGNMLTVAQANQLIVAANQIKVALGCP